MSADAVASTTESKSTAVDTSVVAVEDVSVSTTQVETVTNTVVPPLEMSICLLVVGTYEADILPFISFGQMLLKSNSAHRVRIATFPVFRTLITAANDAALSKDDKGQLEFFPLNGDPQVLNTHLIPAGGSLVPKKHFDSFAMKKNDVDCLLLLENILNSTWAAVTEGDPDAGGEGKPGLPFVANAIVANPFASGHIHVAEKLGIPLHIFSFHPAGIPTTVFPHSLSDHNPKRTEKCNFNSFKAVNFYSWKAIGPAVNRFRTKVLGLKKIKYRHMRAETVDGKEDNNGFFDLVVDLPIPHTFLWSPALVPKPLEWGKHHAIVGTWHSPKPSTPYQASEALSDFVKIDKDNNLPIIYIGFGKMMIPNPEKFVSIVKAAALKTKKKVILQGDCFKSSLVTGTTENAPALSTSKSEGTKMSDANVFVIHSVKDTDGTVPHDWLFEQVSALIHHGGTSTTIKGLLAGKPTMIVPFIGDQFFWAQTLVNAKVGLESLTFSKLTAKSLAASLVALTETHEATATSSSLLVNAKALKDKMLNENGMSNAMNRFYDNLPIKHMTCDFDESVIAGRWIVKDKLKVCPLAEHVIVSEPQYQDLAILPYHAVCYDVHPEKKSQAIANSFVCGVHIGRINSSVGKDMITRKKSGLLGAAKGLFGGIKLIAKPTRGIVDFAANQKSSRELIAKEKSSTTVPKEAEKQETLVRIQLTPEEKQTLIDAFQQALADKKNKKIVPKKAAKKPDVSSDSDSSDDDTVSESALSVDNDDLKVSAAFYKEDGTLQIEFNDQGENEVRKDGKKKDEVCPIMMGKLEKIATKVEAKTKELHAERLASPIPVMNICIMIVGTQGDVQPFVALGKRLVKDGHRVRLATHAIYRKFVMENGLEFYPLGGDPKALSAYMVKTGGQLIPTTFDAAGEISGNVKMLEEIAFSTWPAVSAADPSGGGEGVSGLNFRADAIIANPVAYGHVHVAEKLGCPLHIMFPQPWVPTTAFPHPLSNLRYDKKWRHSNFLSYKVVDVLMWQGTGAFINKFRQSMHLPVIRIGDGGSSLINSLHIPHSFTWSPALVPKPFDWGPEVSVTGTLLLGSDKVPSFPGASAELLAFLAQTPAPVFIGFGSMVMADPAALARTIYAAAGNHPDIPILLQSSWSDFAADKSLVKPPNVFLLGNCPHDWLFPQVSAVIHHGGAGTTAAGLLAAKPTLICPFFGDQPFWGQAVFDANVGPSPVPVKDLTVEKLSQALVTLLDPATIKSAKALAEVMNKEEGSEEAVKAFYANLPIESMVCDVDPSRLAKIYDKTVDMKLSYRAEIVVRQLPKHAKDEMVRYAPLTYTKHGPTYSLEGFSSGAGTFAFEIGGAIIDIYDKPRQGFQKGGVVGALKGVGQSVTGLVVRPINGSLLWADKIATGTSNLFGSKETDSVFYKPISNLLHTNSTRSDSLEVTAVEVPLIMGQTKMEEATYRSAVLETYNALKMQPKTEEGKVDQGNAASVPTESIPAEAPVVAAPKV